MSLHMKPFAAALAIAATFTFEAAAANLDAACCADLEERVSALEATTARKGNRSVSLTLSGEVNKALLIWDNGVESGTRIVDNAAPSEGSKLRLDGLGKLGPGWRAGFVVEIGFTDSSSLFVNQSPDPDGETAFEARLANWYVEGERFGRLTLGKQSSATDNITTIDLSRAPTSPVTWHNRAFGVRYSEGDYSGLAWGNLAWGLDGYRGDFIRYDTPAFHGFMMSVAWGENDAWDLAMRFEKELSTFRIAAGVGYLWVGDGDAVSVYRNDTVVTSGSLSVMHVPTGLFGNFAAGQMETARDAMPSPANPTKGNMWMAQAGIEKRWTMAGTTTFYGEFGRYKDMLGAGAGSSVPNGGAGTTPVASITGTDVSRWGLGAVQNFQASALDVYAVFNRFDADIRTADAKNTAEPWYGVIVGSRLKF